MRVQSITVALCHRRTVFRRRLLSPAHVYGSRLRDESHRTYQSLSFVRPPSTPPQPAVPASQPHDEVTKSWACLSPPIHRLTLPPPHPNKPAKMQAIARRGISARPAVRAARPSARPVKAMAFKVTLKTPSGETSPPCHRAAHAPGLTLRAQPGSA
eukprot:130326-Chlamydomonas_euryale.AAC.6